MKLTVLMDNNTYIDHYYLGEPAFSVYIEDGAEKILFDTGYSDAFLRNAEQMQAPFSRQDCIDHALQVIDGSRPVKITERLTFLGEIPRVTSFESREPIGECTDTGQADFVMDDSALAYEGKEGVFIVTGCSHSGICNIVLQALRMSGHKTVSGIIGGFHLLKKNQQLTETIRFLEHYTKGMLYPCHCVSFAAKHEMMNTLPLTEVGVGLELDVE